MENTSSLQNPPSRLTILGIQQSKLVRIVLSAVVALVPVVAALLVVNLHVRGDLSKFVPYGYDEVLNWHQVLTFKEAGFQGGYYTLYERPAPAQFTHFYTYGPPYPMLYGLVGKVIGWEHHSVLIVNSLLLTAALFFFCLFILKDKRQLVVTAILLLVFWPGLTFLFSTMQESMHQAIGIVAAGIFYVVISRRGRIPLRLNLIFTAFLTLAAITRLSWLVLMVPYFWFISRPRRRLLSMLRCLLLCGVIMIVTLLIGALGNNSVMSVLGALTIGVNKGSILPALEAVGGYFYGNLVSYLNFSKDSLDVLQTIEVVAMIIGAASLSVVLKRRGNRESISLAEANFHAFNLGAIVFASLLLYIIGTGGDYRVIAAHLLLSSLLLIAFRRYRVAAALIAANLLFLPQFLTNYSAYMADHLSTNQAELADYTRLAHQSIQYDASASSPWCNTLLFTKDQYDQRLTAFPGGIGLSTLFNTLEPGVPFKSRYLLMNEEAYAEFRQRPAAPTLQFIARLSPDSNLYLNQQADCG
jgi:hypothetical protein